MGIIPKYKGVGEVARTSQYVDIDMPLRNAQAQNTIIQNIASAGQSVAGAVGELKKKKELADEKSKIANQEIEIKRFSMEERKKFEQEYEDDPNNPDMIEKLKESRLKHIEEVKGLFKTDDGKQMFDRMAQRQLLRDEEELERWSTQKTKEKLVSRHNESVNTLNVIATEDPSLPQALDVISQLDMLKVANAEGLGDANAVKMDQAAKRDVMYNFIETNVLNNDIKTAKDMLKNEEIANALGGNGIIKARKLIKKWEEAQRERSESLRMKKYKNPWEFLDAIGETRTLVPLDFSNPRTFLRRGEFLNDMSKKHGLKMSEIPIHPKEVKGLESYVLNTNDKDMSLFLENLDMTVDDGLKKSFGKQLFPKTPMLAAAINLAGEDRDAAEKSMIGFKRLNSKTMVIKTNDIKKEIDNQLLNYIDNDQQRDLMNQAILAHTVGKAYTDGKTLQEFSSDQIKESIEAVIGPVFKGEDGWFMDDSFLSDSKIVSFRGRDGKFLDKGEFEEIFEKLTPENIDKYLTRKPINSLGSTADLANISSRYYIKTIGDGVYSFLDKKTGHSISDSQGQNFYLNLKEFYFKYIEDKGSLFEKGPESHLGQNLKGIEIE